MHFRDALETDRQGERGRDHRCFLFVLEPEARQFPNSPRKNTLCLT